MILILLLLWRIQYSVCAIRQRFVNIITAPDLALHSSFSRHHRYLPGSGLVSPVSAVCRHPAAPQAAFIFFEVTFGALGLLGKTGVTGVTHWM